MIQWAWNYITQGRGARLITGKTSLPSDLDKPDVEVVTTSKKYQLVERTISPHSTTSRLAGGRQQAQT